MSYIKSSQNYWFLDSKKFLDKIISESQAAFILGRMIFDNIMVVHELMHSLKSRKKVSQMYMAIKTYMSKAYNQMEWNFLEKIIRTFGFSEV